MLAHEYEWQTCGRGLEMFERMAGEALKIPPEVSV